MKLLTAILFFLFPTCLCKILLRKSSRYKISGANKIGFSLIFCESIDLESGTYIGHGNYINIKSLKMGKKSSIRHLNFIKGEFNVNLKEKAWIRNQNKISATRGVYQSINLTLEYNAAIGVGHILDMTDSISLGRSSMLAGTGTQIWTHSFYFSRNSDKYARVDAPVHIGAHCYIGARCTICSGVNIADGVTVGAATVVPKSLDKVGLYVSQSNRFIEFDPDKIIKKLKNPTYKEFIYNKKYESN